jgi:hypothetical protein
MLYLADMGVGPPRPDELYGALDPEGGGISRENAGPLSGGRHVVGSLLNLKTGPHHMQKGTGLHEFDFVMHNGDIRYGRPSMSHTLALLRLCLLLLRLCSLGLDVLLLS